MLMAFISARGTDECMLSAYVRALVVLATVVVPLFASVNMNVPTSLISRVNHFERLSTRAWLSGKPRRTLGPVWRLGDREIR